MDEPDLQVGPPIAFFDRQPSHRLSRLATIHTLHSPNNANRFVKCCDTSKEQRARARIFLYSSGENGAVNTFADACDVLQE